MEPNISSSKTKQKRTAVEGRTVKRISKRDLAPCHLHLIKVVII